METMTNRNARPEDQNIDQLHIAAEQGDTEAQNKLGVICVTGEGAPRDFGEALRWFRLSADQGLASAQFNLGLMYFKGDGVLKDDSKAMKWYRKAAERGHALAQTRLGIMYALGGGGAEDLVRAHAWLNLAAAQGEEKAVEAKDILEPETAPAQLTEAQKLAAELRERIEASQSQ